MGMFRKIFSAALLLFMLSFTCAPGVHALVLDLSNKRIEIRYSFDGADIILFGTVGSSANGSINDPFDVVVVVRGPEEAMVVRRKEKLGFIWVNGPSLEFPAAPGYYAVAANRPLSEIAGQKEFLATGIGFENLHLAYEGGAGRAQALPEFKQALFDLRTSKGLYRQEEDSVTMIGEGLFRMDVHLPANVPVGEFQIDAYLFQNGEFKARERIPLAVDKEGFERAVFSFAHESPFLYGLMAVAIALVAGWIAGVVGKKS
ncbi:TIGR02186 family protein [Kordiimonas sp. SCSIO 12610]|uniref:TIGR02186 family protein n=1 Tax=Kordiimonas sp. SCSIO 12610 TaxID=2829597 RepID=UPI00210B6311|nr:TIGR02186 family protein [Kordiimonas sp. SCSIO 12610]UTW55203.1 TIGR02186 family protein [Kordiimonas sp. SCSIO 12610]